MKKIKSIYIIPLIIIVTVALIPLFLLLFFKAIDDNTWIDFFGGYLGSIISAIVAGGLAFTYQMRSLKDNEFNLISS